MATTTEKKRLCIHDESLNSYGFWVKTKGIDLKQFRKNPVMYYNHDRTKLPIGRWEDIEVTDDGKIFATPVFDLNDPFAKQIADKFENDFLRAASMGLKPFDFSDHKDNVKQGQTYPTLVRSKLIETSISDIPSNDGALVVFYDENENIMDLSQMNLNQILNIKPLKIEKSMKTVLLALGLAENADEAQALAAITSLQNLKADAENRLLAFETEAKNKETARIESLVNLAIKDQKITAAQKDLYLGIGADSGSAKLEQVLSGIPSLQRASTQLNLGADDTTGKTFKQLTKSELEDLKLNDKEAYIALYEKEYGEKPTL